MKNKILVSRCLLGTKCRYDGNDSLDKFVLSLNKYFELIPFCPEVEIGLGVPRNTLRLVEDCGRTKIIDNKEDKDYTNKLNLYFYENYSYFRTFDIFIFKSKSPTCGLRDTKLYNEKGMVIKNKVNGLITDKLLEFKKNIIIESSGRLTNFVIRDLFLYKIFTFSKYNDTHKYLNYCFSMSENTQSNIIETLNSLDYNFRYRMYFNMYLNISKYLSLDEELFFLITFKRLMKKKISISAIETLLDYYKFLYFEKISDIVETSFYPKDYISIKDSGKRI